MKQFNYEEKIWGTQKISDSPYYLQGLKLHWTFDDLKEVQGRILDVGCGAGNMAKAVKRKFPNLTVYGVDVSRNAIVQAKRSNNGVNFRLAPAERLPFANASFDAVLMYDVLEHVEKPEKVLKEIRRILTKDGLFHLFVPLEKQPWTFYWILNMLRWKAKYYQCGHVQVFDSLEVEKMLKECGFNLKKRRFNFHFFLSFVDISYFSVIDFINNKPGLSVEGMIYKQRGFKKQLFFIINTIICFLGYYESLLLRGVYGGGGHFLSSKNQTDG